jgi:hypothetical protein
LILRRPACAGRRNTVFLDPRWECTSWEVTVAPASRVPPRHIRGPMKIRHCTVSALTHGGGEDR